MCKTNLNIDFEYETRDEQMSSPGKRVKRSTSSNEGESSAPKSSSRRIKNLTSKLCELSKEYQELNDLDEFDRLLKTLKIKENQLENEEICPMFRVLPQDLIEKCISFLDKSYGFIAPVSTRFRESYRNVFHGSTETIADFRSLSEEAGVYLIDSFPNS